MTLVALAAMATASSAEAPPKTAEPDGTDDAAAPEADSTAPLVAPPPVETVARKRWLVEQLERLVTATQTSKHLGHARLGGAIVDVTTGETLWSHDADHGYSLASTAKVLTSATALAELGPAFRFHTAALTVDFQRASGTVNGDLILRGHGDPLLTADDLVQLAGDLHDAGVRKIKGDLLLDTSYFDGQTDPPHFDEQPKERAGFRAPVSALSVDGDAIVVKVVPRASGAGAASVEITPKTGGYVRVTSSSVSTVTKGHSHITVSMTSSADHVDVSVHGQIRADDDPAYIRRRIDDPDRFIGVVWQQALKDSGIKFGKAVPRVGAAPPDAVALATHDSIALAEIIRAMLKTSNNFIAETVLKTVGAESRAAASTSNIPATWADGLARVHAYVAHCGVADGKYRFENGSGLFNASSVSPAQLTAIMRCAARDIRVGPELIAALPVAGVDGTLSRRLRDVVTRAHVRAKTGTLGKVATLSGVVGDTGDHLIAFSLFFNDLPEHSLTEARTALDAMTTTLATFAAVAH